MDGSTMTAVSGRPLAERTRNDVLRRCALALLVMMLTAPALEESAKGPAKGGTGAKVGCAACGTAGVGGGVKAVGLKACSGGAAKGAATVAAKATASKVGVAAIALAGAREGEREVVTIAGEAFLKGVDDTTLLALKDAPSLSGQLGKLSVLPRTPEARTLFLHDNPELALDVGRYLEHQDPLALERAITSPVTRPILIPGMGTNMTDVGSAVALKEQAYTTAEKVVPKLSHLESYDPAALRAQIRSLQASCDSGTKITLDGNGAYLQITVTNQSHVYTAQIDLVAAAAAGGGIVLTNELVRRRSEFGRLPDKMGR